jgi:putative NADH-flavin reductase
MKIALIGASGFVGSAVLKEALDRGHQVTAIVRNPEKIKLQNKNLEVVKADAQQPEDVAAAVKGHDAVINAYNPGWGNPAIYTESLKGAQAIQEGVKKAGVNRLFVIGGAGSLYIAPGQQLVDSPEFPGDWKDGALAARDYLAILRHEESLDWTFLSPAIEMHQGTSGERKGTYRKGLENPVFGETGRSLISVEDMAIAILDEIEHPQHIRQRFTVAY